MFFAGLTSVIAEFGRKNVSGDTGLAVRTVVVFVLVWGNQRTRLSEMLHDDHIRY